MRRERGPRFSGLRLGVALGAILLAAFYLSGPQEPGAEKSPEARRTEAAAAPTSASPRPALTTAAPADTDKQNEKEAAFLTRLQKETWRIGQIDENPEKTERELTEWARSLPPEELRLLGRTARDTELEPDQRFLAVDLLGRAGTAEAGELLVDIATSPLGVEFASDYQHSAAAEFEVLLREQAVDSIAELPKERAEKSLDKVLTRVNRTTLIDRIQRHRTALKAQVPPVKEQEKRALSKLLGY